MNMYVFSEAGRMHQSEKDKVTYATCEIYAVHVKCNKKPEKKKKERRVMRNHQKNIPRAVAVRWK